VKRRTVTFSPEARDDLLKIYDWIADAASPAVAMSYIERLEARCLGFDLASERGHRRDDVRSGLGIIGFGRRATIAFAVEEDRVTILRLFQGGQDWERVFS
jgi:toxin ParE1/3/4